MSPVTLSTALAALSPPLAVAPLFLAGWLLAALAMAVLWAVQLRTLNAGVVDVAWAGLVGAIAVGVALVADGDPVRRALVAVSFGLWSLRLAGYLLFDRVLGRPEDGRYAELRRAWGARAPGRFFWFFQAQALAAVFFALPALLPSADAAPAPRALELVAVALWALAFLGEVTADAQLARFKKDPANRGKTCRAGLWSLSRHPNYFFELSIWVAWALLALPSPGGTLALLCPAAMVYLLFRVTGIPATEAQALRTRGDEYRDYQRTTSAFVPWFPKKSAAKAGAAP